MDTLTTYQLVICHILPLIVGPVRSVFYSGSVPSSYDVSVHKSHGCRRCMCIHQAVMLLLKSVISSVSLTMSPYRKPVLTKTCILAGKDYLQTHGGTIGKRYLLTLTLRYQLLFSFSSVSCVEGTCKVGHGFVCGNTLEVRHRHAVCQCSYSCMYAHGQPSWPTNQLILHTHMYTIAH